MEEDLKLAGKIALQMKRDNNHSIEDYLVDYDYDKSNTLRSLIEVEIMVFKVGKDWVWSTKEEWNKIHTQW